MRIVAFFLLTILLYCAPAGAEQLVMSYNERTPYHYTSGAETVPTGVVADIVVRALKDSGIDVMYVPMSPTRIMENMRSKDYFCSFGWFRTDERLAFAKFTHGIIEDDPFFVIIHKEKLAMFNRHKKLAEVFRDSSLRFGTKSRTSYGTYIDKLIVNAGLKLVDVPNTQENMIKMLAGNRFDFMLLVPLEVEPIFTAAGINIADYEQLHFPDIPRGEKRRIMCSKSISDALIERINESIAKHVNKNLLD